MEWIEKTGPRVSQSKLLMLDMEHPAFLSIWYMTNVILSLMQMADLIKMMMFLIKRKKM